MAKQATKIAARQPDMASVKAKHDYRYEQHHECTSIAMSKAMSSTTGR